MHRVARILIALLAFGAFVRAQETDRTKEYKVKAALVANFAKFTTWPKSAFQNEFAPVVIGVWGKKPLGGRIDALAGKRVGSRRIVVKHVRTTAAARRCHVLFVPKIAPADRRKLFVALAGAPTLTVGDQAGFAENGGILNLRVVSGKVRFDVNPKAAARAGLRLHPKLLRSGRIVRERSAR